VGGNNGGVDTDMTQPEGGPSPSDLRRWRRHLANERAEAAVYRDLALKYDGEEREILSAIAIAEERHVRHWLTLLRDRVGDPIRADLSTRVLAFLARHFGSVFVLALLQRFEARASYDDDVDATPTMAADEKIHEEVIRALAGRGRDRLSGSFRAAVFGANDGLVSNLALILGVGASGVASHTILVTGLAGLLAGALSMGAGEFVSVSSQRELLQASAPSPNLGTALTQLDVDANELELVYRARGMSADEAASHAADVLSETSAAKHETAGDGMERHAAVGTGLGAAVSSFLFFATGALIPVLPYLFGLSGGAGMLAAAGLVGAALLSTGVIVGLLSGAPPMRRAMRQLLIGFGAAGITYVLGLLVGGGIG